jgi:E-phenylitaconyl-CoA hydratase
MTESGQVEDGGEVVLVEVRNGVGWVTLNRPAQRNAVNQAVRRGLAAAFADLDDRSDVRVAVMTGNGPAFCAGNDLKEGPPSVEGHPLASRRPRMTAPLDSFTKPVIAAVNGPAYAGGFELALACDLRVGSTDAVFCLSEVRIGSLPGAGGTQRLPRAVSQAVAAKILYTGTPVDAVEAYRVGLISDLTEPAQFVEATTRLAEQIASNAPLSLKALKRALTATTPTSAELDFERALWESVAGSEDYAQARLAFRAGRPPTFNGR